MAKKASAASNTQLDLVLIADLEMKARIDIAERIGQAALRLSANPGDAIIQWRKDAQDLKTLLASPPPAAAGKSWHLGWKDAAHRLGRFRTGNFRFRSTTTMNDTIDALLKIAAAADQDPATIPPEAPLGPLFNEPSAADHPFGEDQRQARDSFFTIHRSIDPRSRSDITNIQTDQFQTFKNALDDVGIRAKDLPAPRDIRDALLAIDSLCETIGFEMSKTFRPVPEPSLHKVFSPPSDPESFALTVERTVKAFPCAAQRLAGAAKEAELMFGESFVSNLPFPKSTAGQTARLSLAAALGAFSSHQNDAIRHKDNINRVDTVNSAVLKVHHSGRAACSDSDAPARTDKEASKALCDMIFAGQAKRALSNVPGSTGHPYVTVVEQNGGHSIQSLSFGFRSNDNDSFFAATSNKPKSLSESDDAFPTGSDLWSFSSFFQSFSMLVAFPEFIERFKAFYVRNIDSGNFLNHEGQNLACSLFDTHPSSFDPRSNQSLRNPLIGILDGFSSKNADISRLKELESSAASQAHLIFPPAASAAVKIAAAAGINKISLLRRFGAASRTAEEHPKLFALGCHLFASGKRVSVSDDMAKDIKASLKSSGLSDAAWKLVVNDNETLESVFNAIKASHPASSDLAPRTLLVCSLLSEAASFPDKSPERADMLLAAQSLASHEVDPNDRQASADLSELSTMRSDLPVSIKARSIEAAEAIIRKAKDARTGRKRVLREAASIANESGWPECAGQWRLISDWASNDKDGFSKAVSSPNCSWASLMRKQSEWHRTQLDTIMASRIGGWKPLLDALALSDGKHHAIELSSAQALHDEGQAMRHCVGSYASNCASGSSAIFSILSKNHEGNLLREATLEIRKTTDEKREQVWTHSQLFGKFNSRLPNLDSVAAEICAAANTAQAAINQRKKEEAEKLSRSHDGSPFPNLNRQASDDDKACDKTRSLSILARQVGPAA